MGPRFFNLLAPVPPKTLEYSVTGEEKERERESKNGTSTSFKKKIIGECGQRAQFLGESQEMFLPAQTSCSNSRRAGDGSTRRKTVGTEGL